MFGSCVSSDLKMFRITLFEGVCIRLALQLHKHAGQFINWGYGVDGAKVSQPLTAAQCR